MDMDVGDDLILGWDWLSGHDLNHLYPAVGLAMAPEPRCARSKGPASAVATAGSAGLSRVSPASLVGGVEVLRDGSVLHLASCFLAGTELRIEGADGPAFAALKAADVLGVTPRDLPPDRGMELIID